MTLKKTTIHHFELCRPVHFLENRPNRKLFAAGFGVVLCTLCRVAFLDSPLPFATGDSKEMKGYSIDRPVIPDLIDTLNTTMFYFIERY